MDSTQKLMQEFMTLANSVIASIERLAEKQQFSSPPIQEPPLGEFHQSQWGK